MSENQTKEIKFGDINYSIYSIGKWNKEYEINLIGTSSEIPASLPTKKHVILQMEQIRNARFNWQETEVNGMIGLALQLNKKLEEKPSDVRLQRQINLLNKASICTIDAFCLEVIKNYFYDINKFKS